MPTLQIRNLDAEVYRRLTELAAREHRSLAQQAAMTLMETLGTGPGGRVRRRAVLERLRQAPPWPPDLPDPAALIAADRRR